MTPSTLTHVSALGFALPPTASLAKDCCSSLDNPGREKELPGVKAFLILPVAAFHLAIMPGRVWTNKLMLDAQLSDNFFKKDLDILVTIGKTVCKFKTVVGLNTFHRDPSADIPLYQPLQKVSGGVDGLLWIGG